MKLKILLTDLSEYSEEIIIQKLLDSNHQLYAFAENENNHFLETPFNKISFHDTNFYDVESLKNHLTDNSYDLIIHPASRQSCTNSSKLRSHYHSNINSTEQVILTCIENNTRLLFISNLDVFDYNLEKIPIISNTKLSDDNSCYVKYLVRMEKLIGNYVLKGLNAQIVRHAEFYGKGYRGIIGDLVKLAQNKLLQPDEKTIMHSLTNIDEFQKNVKKIIDTENTQCGIFNIVDPEPITTNELILLIYHVLEEKNISPKFPIRILFSIFLKFFLNMFKEKKINKLGRFLNGSKFLDKSLIWTDSNSNSVDTMGLIKTFLLD